MSLLLVDFTWLIAFVLAGHDQIYQVPHCVCQCNVQWHALCSVCPRWRHHSKNEVRGRWRAVHRNQVRHVPSTSVDTRYTHITGVCDVNAYAPQVRQEFRGGDWL